MILDEFHLLRPEGAALMLKTIEEPPASTTFVDPRRLRAARPGHDLVAMRADRVPCDRRRRASPSACVAEGVEPQAAPRRPLPRVAASSGPACWPPTPTSAERRRAFAERAPPARRHRCDGDAPGRRTAGAHRAGGGTARRAPRRRDRRARRTDPRYGERGSGKKMLEERHKPRAAPSPDRRAAQRARRDRRHVPRRVGRREHPAARPRSPAAVPRSTTRWRRSSATRTSRSCCRLCCGRSRS